MKNKRGFRLLALMLLIVICMTSFSVTAFASADEPAEESTEATEATEPTEPTEPNEEPTTGGIPLTPDGNMTLVDDIEGEATGDKQFITVVSKNGNYFYIIIDRAGDGENTVHFLNQVDEADLLALIEEEQTNTAPLVCVCTEKCTPGAINTSCEICMATMSKCVGKDPTPEPTEPAEPSNTNSAGALLSLLLILGLGGGAAYYFLVMKPKQAKNVPSDLDDFDLEDEEEYLNEDE